MKNVVITGSNGFVGSSLVTKLIQSHCFHPICLVREGSNIELLPENAEIKYVDYNENSFDDVISKADIVIHVAALTKALSWKYFQKVNIDLTDKIIDICNNSDRVNQMIFISSQAASGPSPDDAAIPEDRTCNPITQYGKSKTIAEQHIQTRLIKPWTIIRPVSVYGPGDKDFLQFFKLIEKHISIYVGQKLKKLNLIYVEDLVDLIITTIDNREAENEIFFATTPEAETMETMVEYSQEILEKFTLPVVIPLGLLKMLAVISQFCGKLFGFVPILNREKVKEFSEIYWIADSKKATTKLGFTAQTNLFSGIYKTCHWYKDKGWLNK